MTGRIRDERDDVLAQPVALPEVAAEGAAQPADILGERIADQPELLAQRCHGGRVNPFPAEDDQHRVARGQTDERERDERDEQEDRDEREQAPERIRGHVSPS